MTGPINPTSLTFEAPQTNADGTNLVDLKQYVVEVSASPTGPWTQVAIVPAFSADPSAGTVMTSLVSSWGTLAPGQYWVAVRAVDFTGNASGESVSLPFVSGDAMAPSSPINLKFS